MRITSADNPYFRRLRRLASGPRACRDAGRTLAEGMHLVECAATAAAVETIVLSQDAAPDARALGEDVAARLQCRCVELVARLYDAISPVQHGVGVLAELSVPRVPAPRSEAADAIYLDGVQDPGNAGTLLRTAAAAGIRHVGASPGTVYLWAPKVLRAAMGAHFVLALHEDLPPAALPAAFAGERLAADAHGRESLYSATWGEVPTVWMFGAEGQGLSAPAAVLAQRRMRIPINPQVESLNVAAAAAVCLFEQARRRGTYR